LSSIRRVFFYLVSLVTLGILAGGAGVLLTLLFDVTISAPEAIGQTGFSRQQLSLGIAMLVIGGPLWMLFWRHIQNSLIRYPAESGAESRHLYLNLILTVTALTALASAQPFLQWLFSGLPAERHISGSLATCIVTLIIWFYHWHLASREGTPSPGSQTLRRWYIYIVSGWSLILVCVSLVQFINGLVRCLPWWGDIFVGEAAWTGVLAANLPALILGSAWWAWHWFRSGGDVDSTLRQVYLYLLTIVGSAIAGLTALVIGLYRTLVWATGAAEINSRYFQFSGWVLPLLLVMAAVWVYHQAVVREEAEQVRERRLTARRIHFYIMSFIGLGAATYGLFALLGTLLNLILNLISPAVAMESGWWQRQLSLCLALLIAGVPLWLYYWNQILKMAAAGGLAEWRAFSRRAYLYLIIAASIIAVAAGLVFFIYQHLGGLLAGRWGIEVWQKARWSIQTVVVVLPLLFYHWRIARQDQRRGAESVAGRKIVSALINPQSREIIAALEKQMGITIRILESTSPDMQVAPLNEEEITGLSNGILAETAPRILLVAVDGKLKVMGYRG